MALLEPKSRNNTQGASDKYSFDDDVNKSKDMGMGKDKDKDKTPTTSFGRSRSRRTLVSPKTRKESQQQWDTMFGFAPSSP